MRCIERFLWIAVCGLLFVTTASAQQIGVDSTAHNVTGLGSNLTPAANSTVCTMSSTLVSQVNNTVATPNGGLGTTGFDSTTCSATGITPTPAPPTPTPTAASSTLSAGAGLGTSPPAPAYVAGSTTLRGGVKLGTGTAPGAGALFTATFPHTFSSLPVVLVNAYGSSTLALAIPYVSAISTTSVTVSVTGALAASQALGTYIVTYTVTP